MDITFNCDRCGQQLTIDETGAGQLVDCPKCSNNLLVPDLKQPTYEDSVTIPKSRAKPVLSVRMGIVTCPSCKNPISSQATACPGCGHPFKPIVIEATAKKWKKMQLIGVIVGIGGLVLFGIFAGLLQDFYMLFFVLAIISFVIGFGVALVGCIGAWWQHG